jgi:hypothetical protein
MQLRHAIASKGCISGEDFAHQVADKSLNTVNSALYLAKFIADIAASKFRRLAVV